MPKDLPYSSLLFLVVKTSSNEPSQTHQKQENKEVHVFGVKNFFAGAITRAPHAILSISVEGKILS